METNLVTLPIAQHVLWHFGDTNLGLQPGTFVERLLLAMSAADNENLAKLEVAFPGYAAAFKAVGRESWGLEWLRSMVKRSLVPDREDAPVDLFEAAAESTSADQVEASYWADHPEAVRSDFQKGEQVAGWGNVGTIVDVRDEGRTIEVEWRGMAGIAQNVASGNIQRINPALINGQVRL